MKTFNFDTAWGSEKRKQWLRENHNKPISLEEFIVASKSFKNPNKPNKGRHWAKKYTLSSIKKIV